MKETQNKPCPGLPGPYDPDNRPSCLAQLWRELVTAPTPAMLEQFQERKRQQLDEMSDYRDQLERYQSRSLTVELDDAGSVVSNEEYYPYGVTAAFSAISPSEQSLKMYRYVGKERDVLQPRPVVAPVVGVEALLGRRRL